MPQTSTVAGHAVRSAWHAERLERVFEIVDADERGLSMAEASERLNRFGPNRLPQVPPPTVMQIFLRQFQNPLIYVLIVAAVVSTLTGDLKDAFFIGVVLAINAIIGGYQEWKAEQSSRALQKLLHIRASVVRDGEVCEVDAEQLAPGDIVWLESGNRVPADMRLISAYGLEVDESLLTGESLAVIKDQNWIGPAETPVADRMNVVYAASIVVRGRAKGFVVSTGTQTEVGKLAVDVLSSPSGIPPLIMRMEKFSQAIAYIVLIAVVIVSVMGMVVHGHSLHQMFLFGVALAVSAIPEGLPAALTVALAVATTRMAARGVIVRRLAAVEGLGSCTMIASDKTGTLTCNELTAKLVWLPGNDEIEVTGNGYAPIGQLCQAGKNLQAIDAPDLAALVRIGVLCNEADLHQRDGSWIWRGDPTDIALLALGHKAGIEREMMLDRFPQVNEIPFEPERQFAATFHRLQGSTQVCVKGAPERVLKMCDLSNDPEICNSYLHVAESLASRGYRVLGLADGSIAVEMLPDAIPPQPSHLRFRGIVGMIDPLRPSAKEAVTRCQEAGITVCMVTGDHPVTALAISRELGLATDASQVISGAEIENRSEDEIRDAVRRCKVFARVAPRQKLELVNAARMEGHFVAVTGDGVNDAPALRAANIGVAMGKSGTDVAREAAELVISDDNFATIVSGVEEGRVAYDNVRKVIYLLVSTGAAEVMLIAIAFALGTYLPLPFLPVQLLWLNLVTNGIQGIALAFEPGEPGILQRRPRKPSEPIFNALMIERTVVSALTMAIVGAASFWWMITSGWNVDSARNALLLLMVLFENVHIGNCRSEATSAFRQSPFRSPFLLIGAICALLVHVAGMYLSPLQSVLRTEPASLSTWVALVLLSLSVFVVMEIHKWLWSLRRNKLGE